MKQPNPKTGDRGIVKEEEVCVCFNLRKAARVVTQLYDEVMRPTGYRGTQITLLGVVSKFQPITVKRLAAFIDTEPTTLLRNLRLLEKNDLIEMNEHETDRRARTVTITDKGAKVLSKAYPLWKKTQDRIAAKVGRGRLNKVLEDLQNTMELIRKDHKSGGLV